MRIQDIKNEEFILLFLPAATVCLPFSKTRIPQKAAMLFGE